MNRNRPEQSGTGKTLLNLALILLIILPFTAAGLWGAFVAHTTLWPPDPDVTMPIVPQGIAFVLFEGFGLLAGGLLGGFLWAAVARLFLTRDEVYRQALFGVRIPLVTDLNKAYLRWLYRQEGAKKR
jgi:hypothetical protein